jgi:uncharacterized protein (DUF4213/DUF364 family)
LTSDLLVDARALLEKRYRENGLEPGVVRLIGLRQAWNTISGTGSQCGVAINFTGHHAVYGDEATRISIDEVRSCVGRSLMDVAREYAPAQGIQRRSLALAAMNALSQPFTKEDSLLAAGYRTGLDMDSLLRKDDVVAVIGYGGMVPRLAGKCRELHVSDMRPLETFRTTVVGSAVEHGPRGIRVHGADENEQMLAGADVAFITASTLVNDTFREVVGYCGGCRAIGVYGPSGMLLPEALFREGVDFIQSIRISDQQRFELDMLDAPDMEAALKNNQSQYTALSPRRG